MVLIFLLCESNSKWKRSYWEKSTKLSKVVWLIHAFISLYALGQPMNNLRIPLMCVFHWVWAVAGAVRVSHRGAGAPAWHHSLQPPRIPAGAVLCPHCRQGWGGQCCLMPSLSPRLGRSVLSYAPSVPKAWEVSAVICPHCRHGWGGVCCLMPSLSPRLGR